MLVQVLGAMEVSKLNFHHDLMYELQLASLALIALGIWLATRPGDCEKYATVPVFVIGAFFLLV